MEWMKRKLGRGPGRYVRSTDEPVVAFRLLLKWLVVMQATLQLFPYYSTLDKQRNVHTWAKQDKTKRKKNINEWDRMSTQTKTLDIADKKRQRPTGCWLGNVSKPPRLQRKMFSPSSKCPLTVYSLFSHAPAQWELWQEPPTVFQGGQAELRGSGEA